MIILLVIICLSALIFFHELGHFIAAKIFGVRVEEFGFGFPPRLFSKKIGETVYSLNVLPFGGFVRLFGEDEKIKENHEPRQFSAQPVGRRLLIVLAGVLMNIIIGWLILSAVLMIGSPLHLAISQVAPASPAEIAGLKQGDIILEAVFADRSVLTDPIKSDDFVQILKRQTFMSVNLKIQRQNQLMNLTLNGRETPPEGQGPLGITLTEIGWKSHSFFQSLLLGSKNTVMILGMMVIQLFRFFEGIFTNRHILETVAGPIGIFTIMTQAGSLGLIYIFQLTALISLNLAVLNLLPFPVLDGGRFIFLIIEKINKNPVSVRLQAVINAIGLVALLVLMILVTIKDISRL